MAFNKKGKFYEGWRTRGRDVSLKGLGPFRNISALSEWAVTKIMRKLSSMGPCGEIMIPLSLLRT